MKELKDRVSAEDKAFSVFADMMIEKIESISEDWQKPWFTEGAMGWPSNLSGRKYNGMNAFMLMLLSEKKGYNLPYFCTFHQVQEMNEVAKTKDLPKVSVLKGEKSFPVMFTSFTCVHTTTKEKIKYDDYKKLSPEEQDNYAVYPRMQVFHVFNVAQTNLAEARPELWAKLVAENTPPQVAPGEEYSFEAVDKMIKDNLWICPIRPKYQDRAYFSVAENEIVVPEKGQFKTGQAFYGTLFHEMTHSTGRSGVLDRLNPTKFGSDDYAREELVAEMGAALVAQHYGISQHIKEDSCAYLKAWLSKLKESPQFIRTTLTDVKKATAMITQKVDEIALEIEQAKREELPDVQAEETARNQQLEFSFGETVETAEEMEVRLNKALLNPQPLRDGVEFANVQRVFEETGAFQFSAPNRITSPRDVAYIFKQLETASIENAFAVLVKDHKPTVVHLGMGAFDMVMTTVAPIIAADQHLQADEIYFIHNHPSGQLKASEADKHVYNIMRGVFGDRLQPGIIINTRSGKFGMFTDKVLGEEALVAGSESVYNIPTYSFTKQVFSKNYREVGYIRKSNDIAAFLSGQRLGRRKKLSYMVLSTSGEIQANVHTHYSRLTAADYFPLAKRIADDVITYGGNTVVTYGSCNLKKQEVQELGKMLKIAAPMMAMTSGGILADHVNVKVKVDMQLAEPTYYYESAVEEGWALREPNAVYNAKEPADEIQGISLSRDEVKELVMDHVREVLSEADIDATLIGVEVYGSRGRGTAQADSDLDVVIEYDGDMKEDGMFNALNDEEPLYLDGVRVDINPIRAVETGTLAQYMERSRAYDANFKADDANLTEEEREIVERAKADGTYLKAPNGQPTQLSPKQWAQVRTKAFKDWFGDWEKAARIEKLRDSKPISIIGNEIEASEDWNQYKKNALNYGKTLRDTYTNQDTGSKINVNAASIKEVLHHDIGDKAHIQSIAAIPAIIKDGIYIDTVANEDTKKNPKVREYQYYVAGLKISDVDYTVKSVIAVDNNGNRYYDHALTKIEKGNLLNELGRITSPASQKANFLSDIKDKRLLSILQTDASKIVNENGEPLVVYHGTTADQETKIWDERTRSFNIEHEPFTIFKRRVDGEKNNGFFFSNNQDNAGGYGYNTYDTYLNLRNPLVIDAKGANYTDVKHDGTRRDTYEWADYAEKNGFDGVVFKNISDGVDMGALAETNTDYVAFSSNQIKSATDNAGAFDVKNADIRYRFAEETFEASVSAPSSVSTAAMRQEIEDLSDKLGVPVAIEDRTTPNGQQFAGERGWFVLPNAQNPNGTVHVNVDNHVSVNDVTQTVLHEVVGHKGLRAVVGKKAFDTLCESVYRSMPPQEQQTYLRRYGSRTVAGEEYMATLAEQGAPPNTPVWAKVITAVKVALNSIGIQVDYTAAEMQELLRKSTRQLERSLEGAIKKVPVKVNGVKLDKGTQRQLALGRNVTVDLPDKKTGKAKPVSLSWDEKQQKLTGRPSLEQTNSAPRHKM